MILLQILNCHSEKNEWNRLGLKEARLSKSKNLNLQIIEWNVEHV